MLAATRGSVPLVLSVPAPGRWLVAAAQQAGSDQGAPDAAQAETAAIYTADFLRTLTPPAKAGLVLAPVPAEAEPEAVMKQVRALA